MMGVSGEAWFSSRQNPLVLNLILDQDTVQLSCFGGGLCFQSPFPLWFSNNLLIVLDKKSIKSLYPQSPC